MRRLHKYLIRFLVHSREVSCAQEKCLRDFGFGRDRFKFAKGTRDTKWKIARYRSSGFIGVHRTSRIDCRGCLTSRGLKDKLRLRRSVGVKRMKDGAIIFRLPARNFSDNIDSVPLNADFTGGLEGTKEPQTVTRKRNVPLRREHWRTTANVGVRRRFDTDSSTGMCLPRHGARTP